MDDDQLLDALGTAVREAAQVPASFLAAGRAAYTWRNVDAELAALTGDRAAPAGTRAFDGLRAFTFTASELTIEVEAADGALLGQVVPPQPGTVELLGRSGTVAAAAVDALGWFALRPVPTGMFRLSFQPSTGPQVLTEWVSP